MLLKKHSNVGFIIALVIGINSLFYPAFAQESRAQIYCNNMPEGVCKACASHVVLKGTFSFDKAEAICKKCNDNDCPDVVNCDDVADFDTCTQ